MTVYSYVGLTWKIAIWLLTGDQTAYDRLILKRRRKSENGGKSNQCKEFI